MVARLFKFIFRFVLFVVFLVVIALGLIVTYIDPNDYKYVITNGVKEKTGRDLAIPGEIRFSFYPWLGVKLGEVSISNASGFEGNSFAKINALDVRLSVKQLLNLQPELGVLYLDGLNITLQKRADGTTNWDDLVTPTASDNTDAEQTISVAADSATTLDDLVKRLTIGAFEINNASVNWQDDSNNMNVALDDFNLRTGTIRLTAPVQYEMSFQTRLSEPALTIDAASSGRLAIKPDFSDITLNNGFISADISGDTIPAGKQTITLSGNIIYSLQDSLLNLIDLTLETAQAQLIIDANVSDLDTNPQLEGKFIVPEFSPKTTLQQLAIQLPEMADARAMQSLSLQLDVAANAKQQSISNLRVSLDNATLNGAVNMISGTIPQIDYQFNLDELDADRYLPPPTETADDSAPVSNTPAQDIPLNIPVELIRSINVKGEFAATRIKILNLNFRELRAKNAVRDNVAQLSLLANKFYAGNIDLLASVDTRSNIPAVSANAKLANVSIGDVLKDFNDMDFLSGDGNLNINIRALAQTSQQLLKSLNGVVAFNFENGEITGINIAEQLRRVEALTNGDDYKKSGEVNSTDFAAISGGGNIRSGVFTWSDLTLQAPLLRATAEGTIDIVEQGFGTDFNAYFVNTKTGQAGKDIDDVRSVRVPISLRGTFTEPKLAIAPNFLNAIGANIENFVETQKEQISTTVEAAKAAEKAALEAKLAAEKAELDAQKAAAAARIKAAQEAAKAKAKEDAKNSLFEKLR